MSDDSGEIDTGDASAGDEDAAAAPIKRDRLAAPRVDDSHPDAKLANQRTEPAVLAREAMERARASARERGAHGMSPQTARRQKKSRQDAPGDASSPQPFGIGRDPRTMSENVEAFMRRMGWTEHIEVASVTARWREVIGDQIADHCEPVSFEEGVLLLRASSSAWATQMQLMAGQVRHRLNEEFGREVVRELRFIGPSDKTWVKGPRRVKGRGPRDTYG